MNTIDTGMDYFLTQIEKYRHQFYRFVLRNVWDSSAAEDVFSSAVLAAYENRSKFAEGTNFRAWMFRILANKCFVTNRETARTSISLDDKDDIKDERTASVEYEYQSILDGPEDFLEKCGDEVHVAFRRLSTAERSCILLRGVERFSYQEIADILEIPVGTVMTHLSRGRSKLRQDLFEYAKEHGIIHPLLRIAPHAKTNSNDQDKKAIS